MKVKIALFFSLIFSILLIAPTVISVVDDSINLSLLVNMNEEEEGNNSIKEIKVKIASENENSYLVLNKIQKMKNISFQSKNYISEYPKITTPPPKYLL
ncbi:hypothetical protein [Polaribacter sp. Hel_I_88]|uniref:hypothetical protein n=1 Tax=Polaribacter sp. Hel_I_88 TaxID=1250006 RepID=UPI00055EA703|nr:hypothetical protein [Polaribacter sp. Hel_I_88]